MKTIIACRKYDVLVTFTFK